MKVRDRLLIGYSAVLLVAVVGLMLGMAAVMSMATTNERAVTGSLQSLEAASQMRNIISLQQTLMLEDLAGKNNAKLSEFQALESRFRETLATARAHAIYVSEKNVIEQLAGRYDEFMSGVYARVRGEDVRTLSRDTVNIVETLREDTLILYQLSMKEIEQASDTAVRHSHIIAMLLAAVAFATLVIGIWVSRRLAKTFSAPLETLAAAANDIARGNFEIKVPSGTFQEINAVTEQFNAMTIALRHFQTLNIENLISEQKRNEAVLSSIDDGLIICNAQGFVERINPVGARQLGCTPESAVGLTMGAIMQSDLIDNQVHAALSVHNSDSYGGEVSFGPDNKKRTFAYWISRIRSGDILGCVIVMRDISGQRAFENLRAEFVLRASHELRTPLTSMRMAVDLLNKQAPFSPDSREADLLATVRDEMIRMQRLVTDLLDLSRMYAKSLELELEPADVAEMLCTAQQRFAAEAEERGISLSLQLMSESVEISIDRARIERVLDNLISNALRYTPAEGEIVLSLQERGDYVRIGVRDTGCGVPAHLQNRIFEPFVQATAQKGGSGLGLAMCKEIVEQHNGRISVQSNPGEGATFSFSLPL